MIKQFAVCGKTFETKWKHQRYCSKKCHDEYRCQQARKQTEEKKIPVDPPSELQKLINRKVAATEGKLDGYQAFCHICGKDFEPAFPKEKYCSDECRQKSTLWQIYMGYPELFNKIFRPLLGE